MTRLCSPYLGAKSPIGGVAGTPLTSPLAEPAWPLSRQWANHEWLETFVE